MPSTDDSVNEATGFFFPLACGTNVIFQGWKFPQFPRSSFRLLKKSLPGTLLRVPVSALKKIAQVESYVFCLVTGQPSRLI